MSERTTASLVMPAHVRRAAHRSRSLRVLAWAGTAGWAALGNAIGGIVLVTVLRLLQVPYGVRRKRAEPAPEVAAIRATRRDGVRSR